MGENKCVTWINEASKKLRLKDCFPRLTPTNWTSMGGKTVFLQFIELQGEPDYIT